MRVFLFKHSSASVIKHAQQLPGIHALLLCHLLHVKAHVLQELGHTHLLSCQLVSNSWAGGIAVWPRAAVNQMQWTSSHRRGFVLLVGVVSMSAVDVEVALQAAVPAVQGSG